MTFWRFVLLVIVGIIVFCWVSDYMEKQNNAREQRKRLEAKRAAADAKAQALLDTANRMLKVPRIRALIGEIVAEAKRNSDMLWSISYSWDAITVRLRDTKRDAWAPVRSGVTIKFCLSEYDLSLDDNERRALLFAVLYNCSFLEYRPSNAEATRSLREAVYADSTLSCLIGVYRHGADSTPIMGQ